MNTFAWTKLTVDEIKDLESKIINTYKSNIKKIKSIKATNRNFENTILAINRMDYNEHDKCYYDDILNAVHLRGNVDNNDSIRSAAQTVEQSVSSQLVSLTLDRELYNAVREYIDGNFKIEKVGNEDKTVRLLCKEELYMIENTELALSRMGFTLPDKEFQVFKAKLEKLTNISHNFRINIAEWDDFILCNKDDLDGCTDRYIASLKQDDNEGKYKAWLLGIEKYTALK